MGEQEIIELLTRRDERGMDELLRHCGSLMKYVIAPILRDPRDREDCVTGLEVQPQIIGQFDRGRGSWNAWLTAIARNAALNRARAVPRHASAADIPENTPSAEPSPEEQALRRERQEALMTELARLPSNDRALIYRKYYYRQSTAQIAAELGLTERAVEGRLYRLKKQLRKVLGGDGHG